MRKSALALMIVGFLAGSCFGVGVTPYNQGIWYNGYLQAMTIIGTKDVGGCESFIVTTNGSDATFEAKWYEDGSAYAHIISTESVSQGILYNVLAKRVRLFAYPTTKSTPEVYGYFR